MDYGRESSYAGSTVNGDNERWVEPEIDALTRTELEEESGYDSSNANIEESYHRGGRGGSDDEEEEYYDYDEEEGDEDEEEDEDYESTRDSDRDGNDGKSLHSERTSARSKYEDKLFSQWFQPKKRDVISDASSDEEGGDSVSSYSMGGLNHHYEEDGEEEDEEEEELKEMEQVL
jgi:hypothetical protein